MLKPFKYAGYPLLLQAVSLPEDNDAEGRQGAKASPSAASQPHWLSPESVPQLQAALELCWLTCVSSQLNGEELARSGGVAILGSLLSRCAAVLPRDAAPTAPAAILATHVLRAFAGMASFTHARSELLARSAHPELCVSLKVWHAQLINSVTTSPWLCLYSQPAFRKHHPA